MSIYWILIVILLLLVVGGLPVWPYNATWGHGYWPSGLGTVLVILLVVMLLTGRL